MPLGLSKGVYTFMCLFVTTDPKIEDAALSYPARIHSIRQAPHDDCVHFVGFELGDHQRTGTKPKVVEATLVDGLVFPLRNEVIDEAYFKRPSTELGCTSRTLINRHLEGDEIINRLLSQFEPVTA